MVEVQQIGQPDCMISVDVSKAYDRLSRPWVVNGMSSNGLW